jgi:hydrogenase maturation protein HypF
MRIGHIKSVRLIGGDESSKNAKATRLSYLYNMSEKIKNEYLDTLSYEEQTDYDTIKKALDMEINSVLSTSMGRLFDAAAAFLNVSERNNYEGQCAIRLETKALQNTQDVSVKGEYIFKDRDMIIGDTIKILKKLLVEKLEGKDVSYIAMKFHKRLVKMAVDMVVTASDLYNTKNVILSGGSFQNTILLENTIKELEEKDYNVYINQKVPSGDGGIALGQVYMELIRNEV